MEYLPASTTNYIGLEIKEFTKTGCFATLPDMTVRQSHTKSQPLTFGEWQLSGGEAAPGGLWPKLLY